jgi:hypothetical protein
VRVLDHAERVAERIEHRRRLDAVADVLHGIAQRRAEAREPLDGLADVRDAPVRERAVGTGLAVGQEPELEAADLEADVERLVEVRRLAAYQALPFARSVTG